MKPTGNVAWIPEPRRDDLVEELAGVVRALLERHLADHHDGGADRALIERAANALARARARGVRP